MTRKAAAGVGVVVPLLLVALGFVAWQIMDGRPERLGGADLLTPGLTNGLVEARQESPSEVNDIHLGLASELVSDRDGGVWVVSDCGN
jgi:hypothetical protein